MKTTKCNGQDVAKISDVEGKGMCKNPEYVDYLRRSIGWRMESSKKAEMDEKLTSYFKSSFTGEKTTVLMQGSGKSRM